MQAGNLQRVRTLSTTHFLGAAVQNAALVENLDVKAMLGGDGEGLAAGRHMRSRLHEIRIISAQQLAWEIELWGKAAGIGGAAIDAEFFLGKFAFASGDGTNATGDTFFHYWVPGLDLSYQDLDLTGQVHIRLINRSAVAKIAGAGGAIVVELGLEATQGR